MSTTFDSSLITGSMDGSQIDEKVMALQAAVRGMWNISADKAYNSPFEWDYGVSGGTAEADSLKVVKLVDAYTGDPYLEIDDAVNGNTWRISLETSYDPGAGSMGDVLLIQLDIASTWTDIMAISSTDIWHKTLGLLSLAGTTSGVTSFTAGTGLTTDAASGGITVGIDSLGVGTAQLAAGAVTKAKLASDSVDDDKVTSAKAAGGNATDGYVLTADGSGGAAWEANAAGGVAEVVSTQTEGGLNVLNVSDGTGTADIALLTFDGDTHIKAGSITGSTKLVANSVSTNKIARPSVSGSDYVLFSDSGGDPEWVLASTIGGGGGEVSGYVGTITGLGSITAASHTGNSYASTEFILSGENIWTAADGNTSVSAGYVPQFTGITAGYYKFDIGLTYQFSTSILPSTGWDQKISVNMASWVLGAVGGGGAEPMALRSIKKSFARATSTYSYVSSYEYQSGTRIFYTDGSYSTLPIYLRIWHDLATPTSTPVKIDMTMTKLS